MKLIIVASLFLIADDPRPILEVKHAKDVLDLQFVPRSKMFISSHDHLGGVVLWSATGERLALVAPDAVPADISVDGRWIVTGDYSGWLRLFSTQSKSTVAEWKIPEGSILSVAISGNGDWIAAAQGGIPDKEKNVIELDEYRVWCFRSDSSEIDGEVGRFINPPFSLDFDHLGDQLALAWQLPSWGIWSAHQGSFLRAPDGSALKLRSPPVFNLHYRFTVKLSSGRHRLMHNGRIYRTDDWSEIWSVYPRVKKRPNDILEDGMACGIMSDDGERFAYGTGWGNALVWDIDADKCVWSARVRQNSGYVKAIALSDDGRFLLTGGRCANAPWDGGNPMLFDPIIRMWELPPITDADTPQPNRAPMQPDTHSP